MTFTWVSCRIVWIFGVIREAPNMVRGVIFLLNATHGMIHYMGGAPTSGRGMKEGGRDMGLCMDDGA